MSLQTHQSVRTLQRQFHQLVVEPLYPDVPQEPVNLIIDATFFSRSDGVLVFRANSQNLYWQFIQSESATVVEAGLAILDARGYQFKSITIDGRQGLIPMLKKRYPSLPIQLCQFHQAQIIRRYLVNQEKL